MKKLLIFLLFLPIFLLAQNKRVEKLKEYKASNGIVYHKGDEFQLNTGSGNNDRFVYVRMAAIAMPAYESTNMVPGTLAGTIVKIKKIIKYNKPHYKGVWFIVGAGKTVNFNMDIENAIEFNEIKEPTKQ